MSSVPGCFRTFKTQELIGEGSWGKVYSACNLSRKKSKNNCRFAIKVIAVNDEEHMESAKRDEYFLKKLNHVKVDKQNISPVYYDSWFCGDRKQKDPSKGLYLLAMQRFQNNMESRGLELAQAAGLPEGSQMYLESELLRMYRIAAKLGELGIVAADLKPDQYLFSKDPLRKNPSIVMTDFGFTSTISRTPFPQKTGWPSNQDYPPDFKVCTTKINISSHKEAIIFNVWHLEAFFITDALNLPTYVQLKDGTICKFIGVQGFGNVYKPFQEQICPQFLSYSETMMEKISNQNINTFSFDFETVFSKIKFM